MEGTLREFAAVDRLSQIATGLAEDLRHPDGQHFYRVSSALCKFFCQMVDGDVAFCRTLTPNRGLVVSSDIYWARWMHPRGRVPRLKHMDDIPCDPAFTGVGERDENLNRRAAGRGIYDGSEMEFLRWLKSEAWISVVINDVPRAVLVVGKGVAHHFDHTTVELLRRFEPFVRAFLHAAEFLDERANKTKLLRAIGAVIPCIQAAPTPKAFYRAVCTLLTCEFGFRFDRAMLFVMKDGALPAQCKMAVGGCGIEWAKQQSIIEKQFETLKEYVRDALDQPIPGEGRGEIKDPLYELVCRKPLFYRQDEGPEISDLIARSDNPATGVKKVFNSDRWIQRVNHQRPGAFCSPGPGEYFFFPLVPLEGSKRLGFVLADLAYRGPHVPEPDFPDLEIVSLVLRLLTQLWHARQDAESYLHWLSAVPTLRHAAPSLGAHIGELENCVKDADWSAVRAELVPVVKRTKQLQDAVSLIDGMRNGELDTAVTRITSQVRELCQGAQQKYDGHFRNMKVSVDCLTKEELGAVRMPPHYLESIFDCLVDNAVCSAFAAGRSSLAIVVKVEILNLPEYLGRSYPRVRISVENDGPPIPSEYAPYLFVERMSTHPKDGVHRGTGLSSIRLQARAFRGEVTLVTANPVEFAVVLEPLAVETQKGRTS